MSEAKKAKQDDPRNVTVRALREHSNHHGSKFTKATGDEYLHPRPAADIATGNVELAEKRGEGRRGASPNPTATPPSPPTAPPA